MESGELKTWLAARLDAEITDLRRLTGGASRETWALRADDRPLVLQRERSGSVREGSMPVEASLLRAAARAGVPVAGLVDSGERHLIAEWIDGETIARRILRDDVYAGARSQLASQCGRALAGIHAIDPDEVPGLAPVDQLAEYRQVLDGYGEEIPAFELAFRWLETNRPPIAGRAVVHGDFRLGNLMVGEDGLRAVVDWELAHVGDPMEDLGWLCTRAWRFGQQPPVAGVGDYDDLVTAYEEASGLHVDRDALHWWVTFGSLKWGVICIIQSRAHLDGMTRSVELAAIGTRIPENEYDLMLELAPDAVAAACDGNDPDAGSTADTGLFGRPTAAELVEAVREYVDDDVRENTTGRTSFHARVASNVLASVQRQLELGPAMLSSHKRRLATLDVTSEAALAAAIRAGELDNRLGDVHDVVAPTVVDKLRVANPRYF